MGLNLWSGLNFPLGSHHSAAICENFAYEARSIHYNPKKKSKGIYGNASKKDLMELKEEGIDAKMIPWVEDKDN